VLRDGPQEQQAGDDLSIFGYYFVESLLRQAGWPRKRGLLRGEAYDTAIADAAIDQMVDWAASLGAGRPPLALQIIAEMFRDRNWDGDDAPEIKTFIDGARESWNVTPSTSPREIVRPTRLKSAFGDSISVKEFQDVRLRVALERNLLEALLWSLASPDRFRAWYASTRQRHQSSLDLMQSSGLAVDALPSLEEWFAQCEEIVHNYERDIGPLHAIPDRLLADARALGLDIGEPA
jgi:hypothetical protein